MGVWAPDVPTWPACCRSWKSPLAPSRRAEPGKPPAPVHFPQRRWRKRWPHAWRHPGSAPCSFKCFDASLSMGRVPEYTGLGGLVTSLCGSDEECSLIGRISTGRPSVRRRCNQADARDRVVASPAARGRAAPDSSGAATSRPLRSLRARRGGQRRRCLTACPLDMPLGRSQATPPAACFPPTAAPSPAAWARRLRAARRAPSLAPQPHSTAFVRRCRWAVRPIVQDVLDRPERDDDHGSDIGVVAGHFAVALSIDRRLG